MWLVGASLWWMLTGRLCICRCAGRLEAVALAKATLAFTFRVLGAAGTTAPAAAAGVRLLGLAQVCRLCLRMVLSHCAGDLFQLLRGPGESHPPTPSPTPAEQHTAPPADAVPAMAAAGSDLSPKRGQPRSSLVAAAAAVVAMPPQGFACVAGSDRASVLRHLMFVMAGRLLVGSRRATPASAAQVYGSAAASNSSHRQDSGDPVPGWDAHRVAPMSSEQVSTVRRAAKLPRVEAQCLQRFADATRGAFGTPRASSGQWSEWNESLEACVGASVAGTQRARGVRHLAGQVASLHNRLLEAWLELLHDLKDALGAMSRCSRNSEAPSQWVAGCLAADTELVSSVRLVCWRGKGKGRNVLALICFWASQVASAVATCAQAPPSATVLTNRAPWISGAPEILEGIEYRRGLVGRLEL